MQGVLRLREHGQLECEQVGKICTNWFTYLITRCYGRTNACICFITCSYNGNCRSFSYIRCSFIFEHCELLLSYLCIIGGITTVFAGLTAVCQNDIKKIIAYSTCSQLGYMFFSCGLSNYDIAFFHLFNHAFFKALLFLGAGAVYMLLLTSKIYDV